MTQPEAKRIAHWASVRQKFNRNNERVFQNDGCTKTYVF